MRSEGYCSRPVCVCVCPGLASATHATTRGLNDTKRTKKNKKRKVRGKQKTKKSNDNNTKNKTTAKKKKHKRNTKEKLSDNTVNRRRPGRKTTQPEGCIPTPEGDGAALEEVSGCISRRDTEALA